MSQHQNARSISPICAIACALVMLLSIADDSSGSRIEVKAIPVALDPEKPNVKVVGRLVFLRGFELVSDNRRFGGLSGLDVSADGRQLTAISDRGRWMTADLRHDPAGRLVAPRSWRETTMLTPTGAPVRGRQRDAEGLTRVTHGAFLVSFEGHHRIWRYPTLTTPPQPMNTPRTLSDAPVNGGLEGITTLPNGAVLGVTERQANGDGSVKGWVMQNGSTQEIAYRSAKGLHPTEVAKPAALRFTDSVSVECSAERVGVE